MATVARRPAQSGLRSIPLVAWAIRNRGRIVVRLVLWLILLYFLFPIIWTLSSSLKTRVELYTGTPAIIPLDPTIENYTFALRRLTGFGTFYVNSLIVTLGAVVLQTTLATLAGYGFARLVFKGRDLIFYTMVMLIFIPRAGGLMAQYELMNFLGLRNSLIGLILAFSAGLAVPCFIMRQSFINLPSDFEDAARVDGCNRLQAFWHVMMPMVTGSMAVVALFEFIRVWGEYLFTLTMIDDPKLFTIGIGVAMVTIGAVVEFGEFSSYGAQAAAYVMAAAPVALFFVLLQRWFVRGLMEGLKL
jgi:ABC-type glycerol-3-phosphate transport system permease component